MALPTGSAKTLLSAALVLGLVLVAAGARAAEVTLAWDANGESDLEGYGVYYRAGTAGPPYDFFGYVGLSEVDDEGVPIVTVTGLQPGTRYHFAITAYDGAGNESPLSASVCAEVGLIVTPCASQPAGSSSSAADSGAPSGAGGSGSGCFIQTSTLF